MAFAQAADGQKGQREGPARLGKKLGAGWRELHVGSGLMQFQPAPFNGELQAGLYSAGVPLSSNRNGPLIFST